MMRTRCFVFLVFLTLLASSSRSEEKVNVLFLAIDDLKPTLGCYGDKTALTPNIDRIASSGIVFSNAHCQWPVCGPSRASLMTSLRPEASGVMDLKTSMREKNPDVVTIPQYFREHGYITAGTGKIYDPRCVDEKKSNDAPSWSVPFRHHKVQDVSEPDGKEAARAPDVEDVALTDGLIAQEGLALLRELKDSSKPFFLAVGFKKPHLPFVAPKRYWDLYERESLPLAAFSGEIEGQSGFCLHNSEELRGYGGVPESGPIPVALQRELIHGYYACTSFIDAQVGLFLDELEALGLSGTTAIVLWGDHGFHLGDHSLWGKHTPLEQATRAPLLFSAPGFPKGKTLSTPVEFTDIFPTLCDVSMLPLPQEIHGRSLVPVWRGEAPSARMGALSLFSRKGAFGYSYRTERYRYIEWVNKFGKTLSQDLFDYETDPNETRSIAGLEANAALVKQLAKDMKNEAAGAERLFLKQ